LLTSLASFGLGGYLAGRLRAAWVVTDPHEVEFRDGIHGLLVWGLAIIIGAFLALALTRTIAGGADLTRPTSATAEPLLAFELDRLFRSDRKPTDPPNDPEIRAQAARIITAGLGHTGIAPDDRAYLVRLVEARTGLAQPEAEGRVNLAISQASDAISRARRGAVILAFMIAASLLLGAAVAWLAAAYGGQHRDDAVAHHFWRRWDVDHMFFIR
jgi:MFS family permease